MQPKAASNSMVSIPIHMQVIIDTPLYQNTDPRISFC